MAFRDDIPLQWDEALFYRVAQFIPQKAQTTSVPIYSGIDELGWQPRDLFLPFGVVLILFFLIYTWFKAWYKKNENIVRLAADWYVVILTLFLLGPINLFIPFGPETLWGVLKVAMLGIGGLFGMRIMLERRGTFFNSTTFVPFALYVISVFLAIAIAPDKVFSINDFKYLLFGFVAYFLGFSIPNLIGRFKSKLNWLCRTTLWTSLFVLGLLLYQQLFYFFFFILYPGDMIFILERDIKRGRITPIADIEFYLIFFLVFFTTKQLKLKLDLKKMIVFGLALMAVLLSNTRYRFMVAFISLVAYIWLARVQIPKRLLAMSGGALVGIGLFYFVIASFYLENNLWQRFTLQDYDNDVETIESRLVWADKALELFSDSPWYGAGLGNYSLSVTPSTTYHGSPFDRNHRKILEDLDKPHNWILLIMAEGGVMMLIPFVWLLAVFAQHDWNLYQRLSNDLDRPLYMALIVFCWVFILGSLTTNLQTSLALLIYYWTFRGILEKKYLEVTA